VGGEWVGGWVGGLVVWLREKGGFEWHEQPLQFQARSTQVGVRRQTIKMDVAALFPQPLAIACRSLSRERDAVRGWQWGSQVLKSMEGAPAEAVGIDDLPCHRLREWGTVSVDEGNMRAGLPTCIEDRPHRAAGVAQEFRTVQDSLPQSRVLCTLPCAFSRIGMFDDDTTSFQGLDDLRGVEQNKTVVACFVFLCDARLSEATERDKIASNGGGSVFDAFTSESTEELIQLITAHFCRMRFAFGNNTSGLKAVDALQIKFTARRVDVKPQVVVSHCKEQILRQPCEKVTTLVVSRSKDPECRWIVHIGVAFI